MGRHRRIRTTSAPLRRGHRLTSARTSGYAGTRHWHTTRAAPFQAGPAGPWVMAHASSQTRKGVRRRSGGASGSGSALSCPRCCPLARWHRGIRHPGAERHQERTGHVSLPAQGRKRLCVRILVPQPTVTRGGIGGDATFWPAQGVPFVCQALTFPQVRAWQPDTRCGWETLWAGLPGVCSRLIDLAERGECLPCESQRRG